MIHMARDTFTPHTLKNADALDLQDKLNDLIVWNAHQLLQRRNDAECFLELFKAAQDGQLQGYQTFQELCMVLADQLKHDTSNNKKLKYGICYPKNFLNFMTLVRSYGGDSAHQYGIITSQLAGPSPHHLRWVFIVVTESRC